MFSKRKKKYKLKQLFKAIILEYRNNTVNLNPIQNRGVA